MILEIKGISSVLLIVVIILTSCSEKEIKPVKFKVRGEYLDCNSTYINNVLKDVICLDEDGKILMKKEFFASSDSSTFYLNYDSGLLREHGFHYKNNPVGIWESYFNSGTKESYRYYVIQNDTSFIFYEKIYTKYGNLESSILPVKAEINSSNIFVDSTYELTVRLEYSEFDTLKSIVFFNENKDIEFERDSILSQTREVIVNFVPRSKGELIISGLYAELGLGIVDENNIADRQFSKIIKVK